MNKIGKALGFIGGALAILWAMRDRLVSIAAPHDPEPPRFRVVPPSGSGQIAIDDLTELPGVGPVFAGRLRDAGVSTFADVASSSTTRLAEITGASEARVTEWVTHAATKA